jgi:Bacteriophage tail sheath protein
MPEHLFPGVFVEEAASSTRAIAGVPTSTSAFVGATASGPIETLSMVGSFAEYEALRRTFRRHAARLRRAALFFQRRP